MFTFTMPSESSLGEAKGENRGLARAEEMFTFTMPSESSLGEAKTKNNVAILVILVILVVANR